LCGADEQAVVYRMPDTHYARDRWFTVVECQRCGLGFVNPRPTRAAIDEFYPADFFASFEREDPQHQRRYARQARYLAGIRPPDGRRPRLLDVGCANGNFPRFMRARGWDVVGVEPASNALPIDDFEVHRLPFPEIEEFSGTFDAVTAWAVLEHVHDPMAYFRKAAQVLAPGGLFVFLVTNFASVSSRHLFREDVPRHLYFFTRSTVERYLETANMRLVASRSDNSIFEMRPVGWLRYFARRAFGRPPIRFEDAAETRIEYFRRMSLRGGVKDSLRFAIANPITSLDRLLLPVYERWQIWRQTYGIVTFVARKLPGDGGGPSDAALAK
jgi:SAM-dependent methyltransferase